MSASIPLSNRYRVAAIQYEPTLGEKEKNVTDLLRLVEEAAQHEARLIVLPEMATTGYCWESRAEIAPHVEPVPGPTTHRFQQLAASYDYLIAANRYGLERGVQFSGGSCILNPDGSIQAYLDNGEGIVYGEVDLRQCRDKSWGPPGEELTGNCLADRRPAEYMILVNNTYLWEPLRYHGLYALGELPPGQLSCVGIIQTNLQEIAAHPHQDKLQTLRGMVESLMN